MNPTWPLCAVLALLCACSRAAPEPADTATATAEVNMQMPESPPPEPLQSGWYTQHGDATETFQPCGEARALLVGSADLRARAKDGGLAPDTPVYVRVRGRLDGPMLAVASVEQYGSETPVSDCSLAEADRDGEPR